MPARLPQFVTAPNGSCRRSSARTANRCPPFGSCCGGKVTQSAGRSFSVPWPVPNAPLAIVWMTSKKSLGPNLSQIGDKLGKEALLDSILNPSAGIAPEYYVWRLQTKTEGIVVGIVAEDTPQRVTVLTDATTDLRFKPSEILSRQRSRLSLMPEDLANTMTEQQMVDVLAFLTTLKKEAKSASR